MRTPGVALVLLLSLLCLAPSRAGAGKKKPMAVPRWDVPWTVAFHDHSGNAFRFWQDTKDASARFEYSPVQPKWSSSGTYSGGSPKKGRLGRDRAAELAAWIRKLESDPALRGEDRNMGTGAFHVKEPVGGSRDFIIKDCPLLREFDRFVAPFRGKPGPGRPALKP
jgi:hypothetical protein